MEMRTMETSISRYFGDLPDPRIERCKLHTLTDIVSIAVCAIISNADGAEDIAAYGRAKEPLLRRFLELSCSPRHLPLHLHCSGSFSFVQVCSG